MLAKNEQAILVEDYSFIAGIDEVGRGPFGCRFQ